MMTDIELLLVLPGDLSSVRLPDILQRPYAKLAERGLVWISKGHVMLNLTAKGDAVLIEALKAIPLPPCPHCGCPKDDCACLDLENRE